MGEWLVDFRGRKPSAFATDNFLWKHDNVYVMDNHRAALWCWLREIDLRKPHSLFHIDRHYDTVPSETLIKHLPSTWDMGINDYLNLRYESDVSGILSAAPL